MFSPDPGPARPWFLRVVGIALLLRVAVVLPGLDDSAERFTRPDTAHYLDSAQALVETGRYLESPDSAVPAVVRGPGFSLLLAPLLATGVEEAGMALFLCLLGSLTAGVVFLAGREYAGTAVGAVAGLLYATHLTTIVASPLILSDTWFGFLVAIQCWLALRWYRTGRLRLLAALALVGGFSALVRPLGLPWSATLLLLAFARPAPRLRVRFGRLLLAAVLFSSVTVPWMARNASVGGGFRLDTAAGNALLEHVAVVVIAREEGGNPDGIRERIHAETQEEFARDPEAYATEGARSGYQFDRAMDIFRRYPATSLRMTFQPMTFAPDVTTFFELLGVTRGGKGTMAILTTEGPWAAVRHYFGDRVWLLALVVPFLLQSLLLYGAAAVEGVRGLLRRDWILGVFLLSFVVVFVFPVPLAVARYVLPVLPLLSVLAGVTLVAARGGNVRRAIGS